MSKTDAIKDIDSKIAGAMLTARRLTGLANNAMIAGQWKIAARIHESRDEVQARADRLSRLRDKWTAQ